MEDDNLSGLEDDNLSEWRMIIYQDDNLSGL